DPNDIKIRVSVNDNVKQVIDTSQVIRKASALLSEISTFMTFREGDVLLLGIFDGAPIAQVGDTVRIDVDEIGSLENRIIKESEPPVGGGVLWNARVSLYTGMYMKWWNMMVPCFLMMDVKSK